MRLVLASASPRRRELLSAAGIAFDVDAADVDETPANDESPSEYVLRVARAKAAAVSARHPARPVLAADTAVIVDSVILGKPVDTADAVRMLELLSGRTHAVLTAVVLMHGGATHADVEETTVWMSPLGADDIKEYVKSGEPLDKAGAYAIQGLASKFIPRIEGSYSNVVGLPVATVAQLLRRVGLP